MRVILFECKKVLLSPIFIILFLLFTSYNLFFIYTNSEHREELTVVNELIDSYGTKVTDESLQQLDIDLKQELVHFNQMTDEKIGRTFASVNEFFEQLLYEDVTVFTNEEWEYAARLQLKELYFMIGKEIDEQYEAIDVDKIAQFEMKKLGLRGTAADTFKKEYDAFAERFEELKANGEHKEWFFLGEQFGMHSLFFRTLFKSLVFETLILTVLATAFITNYEYEHRTHLVSYSTWRGRKLKKDKFVASLFTSSLMMVLLFVITFSAYFICFDYTHMFGQSISSAFNWELELPYATWWQMSFSQYTLWSVILVFVCILLFSMLTFGLAIITKNSYFTFLLFAIFFGSALMMPMFPPSSSNFLYLSVMSLPTMSMNPHIWFMGLSGIYMLKYYELTTVFISTVMMIVIYFITMTRFNKKDIH